MGKTRRAIQYIRASTNAEMQANSFGVQEYSISSFAESNGYTIEKTFCEYVSASKNVIRTEWNAALDYLRDNPGAYLIIHSVSRATRSLRDWMEIEELLPFIRFANMDNNEPNILLVSILIAVAQAESNAISSRTKLAIAKKKRETVRSGEDWKWGNQNLGTPERAAKARAASSRKAEVFAAGIAGHLKASPLQDWMPLWQKVDYLNKIRVRTIRGKKWTSGSLYRVLTISRRK